MLFATTLDHFGPLWTTLDHFGTILVPLWTIQWRDPESCPRGFETSVT